MGVLILNICFEIELGAAFVAPFSLMGFPSRTMSMIHFDGLVGVLRTT